MTRIEFTAFGRYFGCVPQYLWFDGEGPGSPFPSNANISADSFARSRMVHGLPDDHV